MGFKDAWNAQMERSKAAAADAPFAARYGGHYLAQGSYHFALDSRPIAGAVAEFENGADIGGRTTLARVAVGAIIAGPVGAIVGGMFKKDRAKVYVTTTFPDGEVIILEAPAKDESKLREFTRKVNAAAKRTTT